MTKDPTYLVLALSCILCKRSSSSYWIFRVRGYLPFDGDTNS